jgi:pimeloyl-ACP methyl ester carboxylesterase
MKKSLAIILLFLVIVISRQVNAQAVKTGYAPVNGMKMYYEVHGSGDPIVLLHGAYMTIEGPIREMAQALKKNRRVIVVELQGHGRTADVDRRAITYEQMADDVAVFLKYMKLDSTDIFGYSMGAGTAVQLAIRHPRLVKKMILASVSYNTSGWSPELMKLVPTITPAVFEGSLYKKEYDSLAPRKENFAVLVQKLKALDMAPQDWPAESIKAIKAPVLLMIGDSDAVTLEHAVDMFKLLGGGVMGDLQGLPRSQLSILPGTTHVGMMYQMNLLLPITEAFLNKK